MDNDNSSNKSINDEIVDHLVIQVNALEKREIKIPDYSERFNALEKLIVQSTREQNMRIGELKTAVAQQNLANPAEQLQAQIDALHNNVAQIPEVIPVRHHHHVDVKTKPFIYAGTVLLILVAVSNGLNIYLWTETSRLHENDVKFRMVRQMFTKQANTADSFYTKAPIKMEKLTDQLETEALERTKAADIAGQKEREAKEAKTKMYELQRHRRQH